MIFVTRFPDSQAGGPDAFKVAIVVGGRNNIVVGASTRTAVTASNLANPRGRHDSRVKFFRKRVKSDILGRNSGFIASTAMNAIAYSRRPRARWFPHPTVIDSVWMNLLLGRNFCLNRVWLSIGVSTASRHLILLEKQISQVQAQSPYLT